MTPRATYLAGTITHRPIRLVPDPEIHRMEGAAPPPVTAGASMRGRAQAACTVTKAHRGSHAAA